MAIKPPWFDPPMLVGTTLQGYRLERFLGAGGFGAVYLTADANGEPRAIKVLFPPHSRGNEDMEVWRFRSINFGREALATAGFRHPNIIRVFDAFQVNWYYQDPLKNQPGHLDLSGDYPLHVYVAEYIPDGVDRWLEDGRLFSPDETINIGVQICGALGALHSADPQVLHRDLNPGNIRLAEGDRAVVTDFGVARIDGLPPAYVDREGPIFFRGVGAPEQFAGEEVDERTDIYQLGGLLVVMLTGKYPNQGGANLLVNRKDSPRRLTEAIQQALQHDPAQRFQSAAAMKDALQARGAPVAPRPDSPPIPMSKLWEFQLESPNWRTWSTPVSSSAEGCFIWDRSKVHRVDPTTGETLWSWSPAPGGPQAGIRDGPQSSGVQAGGQHLYVRHGSLLSCLRSSDGARRWEHQHWSDVTGDFLLANGLIVLDSHRAQDSGLLGVAALNAQTGELAWHLEEPYYHVTSMAAAGTSLVLVEHLGLGGLGGSRLRLLELTSGETLAIYDLFRSYASESGSSGEYVSSLSAGRGLLTNPEAGRTGLRRPLIMADGSIVAWSSRDISPSVEAYCFDSLLALRWTRMVEVGSARPDPGTSRNNFLVNAGNELFCFLSEYLGDARAQQGWVTRVGLEAGELGQPISLPNNSIPLSGVEGPDGSILFLAASQRGGEGKRAPGWSLMSLIPNSEEILSLEPEGMSHGGLMPLAPISTASALYLQVPAGTTRRKAHGPPVRASIAAFQWL